REEADVPAAEAHRPGRAREEPAAPHERIAPLGAREGERLELGGLERRRLTDLRRALLERLALRARRGLGGDRPGARGEREEERSEDRARRLHQTMRFRILPGT